MKSTLKLTLLTVGVALAAAAPSFAQSTSFTMATDFSNDGVVTITDNGGQSYESVYAGRYDATVGGAASYIFCVDPAHVIYSGTSYTADIAENITTAAGTLQTHGPSAGYYNGGLSSAMNSSDLNPQNLSTVTAQERSDEVAFLADDYLNATQSTFTSDASGTTNLNQNETAVQLAIWNIITDGGYSAGNYLTGDFGLQSGTDPTYVQAMDYYLQEAAQYDTTTSSDANWIQAPVTVSGGSDNHYQDFVQVDGGVLHTPTGVGLVPEPNIGAFLFSLAAAMGIMIVLKRRTAAQNA